MLWNKPDCQLLELTFCQYQKEPLYIFLLNVLKRIDVVMNKIFSYVGLLFLFSFHLSFLLFDILSVFMVLFTKD